MEALSLSLAWWCHSWHTLVSPWITHTANLVLTVLHNDAEPSKAVGHKLFLSGSQACDGPSARAPAIELGESTSICRFRDSKSPCFGTWKSPQNGTIGSIAWFYSSLFQMTQNDATNICRSSMMPTMDDPPPTEPPVSSTTAASSVVFSMERWYSARSLETATLWHVDNRLSGYHSYTILMGIPSGNGWHSYWKWPFIVDLPIKNGDFP